MQKTTKVVITWTVVLAISALLIWIIYIYYPSASLSGQHSKNSFEDAVDGSFIKGYTGFIIPELYEKYYRAYAPSGQMKPLNLSVLKSFSSETNAITFEIINPAVVTKNLIITSKLMQSPEYIAHIYLINDFTNATMVVTVKNPAAQFTDSKCTDTSCTIYGTIKYASNIIMSPTIQYYTALHLLPDGQTFYPEITSAPKLSTLPLNPQGDSYTETSQGVPIIIPGAVNESTSGGTGVRGALVTDTPFDFNNEDAPYYDTLPVQSELKNISTPPVDMLVGTAKFDSPETTTGTLKFKFTFITDKPRITQAQFRNYLSELKPSTIPRNHFILIEKSVAADRIIIKGYVTSSIANITSDYIAFNVSGISAAKQLNNLEFIVYVDPLLYRDYLTNSTALAAQQQAANNATALAAQQKTANNALAAQQQSANNATTLAARQKAENNAITLAARQKAENNAITLAARQKAENNAIALAARQKTENNAILAAQQKTGNNAILAAQQKTGNNAILAAQQQSSQAAPNFINSYALNIVDPELYSEYILNLAQTKPLGISNLKTFDSSNNGITFEVSQFNAETLTAVKSYKATSIDIYLIYNSDKTLLVTVQNPATTFAQCSSTSNISCNITGIITSASSIIIPPHVPYNTSVLIPWLRNVGNTGNLPKYRSSDVPPNTPELRSSDVPPNTPELPIAYGYNNGEYIAPSLNNRGVPQSPIDAYNRTVHHTNNANYPFAQPSPELERNMAYKLLEKGITMFGTYLNNPMEHVLKHSNPGTFISQIDYKGSTNVYSPYIKMI